MKKKNDLIWYITAVLFCAALCTLYESSKLLSSGELHAETSDTQTVSEQTIPDRSVSDDIFIYEETGDDVFFETLPETSLTVTTSSEMASSRSMV